MKRTSKSLLFFLGIFLIVFVLVFSGYKYWQKSNLEVELNTVESQLSTAKNKLLTYQDAMVRNAINAKKTIDSLELIKWSVVIDSILEVLPAEELVNIVSYSASSTDTLSMSIKTVSGDEDPYLSIADFIEYFDESDSFSNNFVSSISSGTDEEGEEILTFSFSNSYVGEQDYSLPKTEESIERS